MGANQKEAVAALHRERMLAAAEELFQQKGFEQTTIDDISKASGYSRRTLYAYYVNKEDFLRQIVRKGLRQLDGALEAAVGRKTFEIRYFAACEAILRYLRECPQSAAQVQQVQPQRLDGNNPTVGEILALGQRINERLAEMREETVQLLRSIDPVLSLHDFRMVPGKHRTNLVFDVLVPFGYKLSDEDVRKAVRAAVEERHPDCRCIIQIDKSYT